MMRKTKFFIFGILILPLFLGCAHSHVRETESRAVSDSTVAGDGLADTIEPQANAYKSAAPSDKVVKSDPPRDVSGLLRKNRVESETTSEELGSVAGFGRQEELSPWRSVFAAIFVLGLLVAVNFVLRRRMHRSAAGHEEESDMNLLGSLALDHRRRLLLVSVGPRRALLCSGRDGVVSIATFDPTEPADFILPQESSS